MNLLLVTRDELDGEVCTLADRRAEHLRRVLGVKVGQVVRAGIVGGPVGSAEVIFDDGAVIVLRVTATAAPPPPLGLDLVLAVPRPKVLSRVVETCAAFAVRSMALTNAWRVDKSYLRSPRLEPAALAHAARLGAEQGATTHVPEIAVYDRLMALLDSRYAGAAEGCGSSPILARPRSKPWRRRCRRCSPSARKVAGLPASSIRSWRAGLCRAHLVRRFYGSSPRWRRCSGSCSWSSAPRASARFDASRLQHTPLTVEKGFRWQAGARKGRVRCRCPSPGEGLGAKPLAA